MTGREQEVSLVDELEQLGRQADEVDGLFDEADDSASAETLQWSAAEIDQQGAAVAELIEKHGADATVTVRGLTLGEFGRVEDRVEDFRRRKSGEAAAGYERVVFAAAGLVDAPFFNREDVDDPPWEDRSASERLDAKIKTVRGLDPALGKWLYRVVDDETSPDQGNGQWRDRV